MYAIPIDIPTTTKMIGRISTVKPTTSSAIPCAAVVIADNKLASRNVGTYAT
jgi:hypothetical protein